MWDVRFRIVDCGLRIAECGMWDVGWRMLDVECGKWIADCGLRNAECGMWDVGNGTWNQEHESLNLYPET